MELNIHLNEFMWILERDGKGKDKDDPAHAVIAYGRIRGIAQFCLTSILDEKVVSQPWEGAAGICWQEAVLFWTFWKEKVSCSCQESNHDLQLTQAGAQSLARANTHTQIYIYIYIYVGFTLS